MELLDDDDSGVCVKEEEKLPLRGNSSFSKEVKEVMVGDRHHNMEDDDDDKDEEKDNGEVWDSKMDFFLSLAGYAVGLGNIWRFPYLCYKNGGGAFLVPFLLMLLLVGMPLFLLESAMGQFCSKGGFTVYSVCPALMGSGYASIVTNIVVHAYYSIIITYPLMFIYNSFTSNLPWSSCNNTWNTPDCYLLASVNASERGESNQLASVNASERAESNQLISSADEFFHNNILNISGGIGEAGNMVWSVLGTNIIVWIILFLSVFKGVKVLISKVVCYTAPVSILLLLILLIRGVTLPGALDGLHFYLYPDFDKLWDGQVWAAAAIQIFYTMGTGWSGIIIMGSHNKFNNNCLKDAVIFSVFSCSASILAGFVVFSVLGFMAHEMGTTIDKVTAAGPALIFVTYPGVLSMMPWAPFWSVLFFSMVFFAGLDTIFIAIEVSISSILDRVICLRKWRTCVTIAVCFSMCLMASACCTQGGMYVLQLMDWYSTSFAILSVCLCEVFIFSIIYGAGRTIRDIQMMTKKHVNYLWYICLLIVTPIVSMMMFVNQAINFAPASYRGIIFPNWAQGIGWVLALLPTLTIPIFSVIYFCRSKGSFRQRIVDGFTPTAAWGPASAQNRKEWEEYCRNHPLRHRLLHPDLLASSDNLLEPQLLPISIPNNDKLPDV